MILILLCFRSCDTGDTAYVYKYNTRASGNQLQSADEHKLIVNKKPWFCICNAHKSIKLVFACIFETSSLKKKSIKIPNKI